MVDGSAATLVVSVILGRGPGRSKTVAVSPSVTVTVTYWTTMSVLVKRRRPWRMGLAVARMAPQAARSTEDFIMKLLSVEVISMCS